MEQLIIAGYIPFTNIQITFTVFAVAVSVAIAVWFLWSLEVNLKHPEPMLPPNIGTES